MIVNGISRNPLVVKFRKYFLSIILRYTLINALFLIIERILASLQLPPISLDNCTNLLLAYSCLFLYILL